MLGLLSQEQDWKWRAFLPLPPECGVKGVCHHLLDISRILTDPSDHWCYIKKQVFPALLPKNKDNLSLSMVHRKKIRNSLFWSLLFPSGGEHMQQWPCEQGGQLARVSSLLIYRVIPGIELKSSNLAPLPTKPSSWPPEFFLFFNFSLSI